MKNNSVLADMTRTVLTKKKLPKEDDRPNRTEALLICTTDAVLTAFVFGVAWLMLDYFMSTPMSIDKYVLAATFFFAATFAMDWYRYRRGVKNEKYNKLKF